MRMLPRPAVIVLALFILAPALAADDSPKGTGSAAIDFDAHPEGDLLISLNSSSGLPTLPQMRAEAGYLLMLGVAEWFSVGIVPELFVSGPSFPSPVGISYRGYWGMAASLALGFAFPLGDGATLGFDLRGGIVYGNYLLTNQEILYLRAEARPTYSFFVAKGMKLSVSLPILIEPRPDVLVVSAGVSAAVQFGRGGR